jgi:hypothetical protein
MLSDQSNVLGREICHGEDQAGLKRRGTEGPTHIYEAPWRKMRPHSAQTGSNSPTTSRMDRASVGPVTPTSVTISIESGQADRSPYPHDALMCWQTSGGREEEDTEDTLEVHEVAASLAWHGSKIQ